MRPRANATSPTRQRRTPLAHRVSARRQAHASLSRATRRMRWSRTASTERASIPTQAWRPDRSRFRGRRPGHAGSPHGRASCGFAVRVASGSDLPRKTPVQTTNIAIMTSRTNPGEKPLRRPGATFGKVEEQSSHRRLAMEREGPEPGRKNCDGPASRRIHRHVGLGLPEEPDGLFLAEPARPPARHSPDGRRPSRPAWQGWRGTGWSHPCRTDWIGNEGQPLTGPVRSRRASRPCRTRAGAGRRDAGRCSSLCRARSAPSSTRVPPARSGQTRCQPTCRG